MCLFVVFSKEISNSSDWLEHMAVNHKVVGSNPTWRDLLGSNRTRTDSLMLAKHILYQIKLYSLSVCFILFLDELDICKLIYLNIY